MYQRMNPRTLLASLTLAAALSTTATALPTDGQVTNGQVNIGSPVNGQMTIQQLSDRAIINWNGFSINASEALRFIQPSQLSAILNRVTGQDPSIIMGSLQANGRVFLINPNGILFGAGSQVNVGSLMASTLNITDENFLNDRFKFDQVEGKSSASIVNQGTLSVSPGGFLVLTSPLISNQGVIVANVGQVALAAGEHTEINFDGRGLINIQVDKSTGQSGPVAISNGMLDHMVGGLVGLAPADAVTQLPDRVEIAGASGRIVNTGEIHADASLGQQAGRIILDSDRVTLVQSGSQITANSLDNKGNGGTVQVLSNGLAALDQGASVQARGGNSGNGGFVELSGKGRIWVEGDVDVRAVQGTAGVFLLDPADLTITSAAGSLDGSIVGNGNSTQNLNPGGSSTVSNTFINGFAGGLLTLQADNTITQNNDAPIAMTSGSNLRLTTTTGDINLNATINTNAGTLTVDAGHNLAFSSDLTGATVSLIAANGGSIANAGATAVVGGTTVNLTAPGGIFGNDFVVFPVLATANPLRTDTPHLNINATGGTGNVWVTNAQYATVNGTAAGAMLIDATGSVTVGTSGIVANGAGTVVRALGGAGDILTVPGSGRIGASTNLTQLQANNIGTAANPVQTAGATLTLLASGTGGVNIDNSGASAINLNVPNGPVNIQSTGNVGIGNSTFSDPLTLTTPSFTTSATNPFRITTSSGLIGYDDPAAAHTTLQGTSVTLGATGGVGGASRIAVNTPLLNVNTGIGLVQLSNGQVSSANVTSTAGGVDLTSTADITVGSLGIAGGASTTVVTPGDLLAVTATSGSVGSGGTTTITAHALGSGTDPLKTAGSTLVATASTGANLQHNGSATVSAAVSGGALDLNLTGALTVGPTGIAGSTGTGVNATGDMIGSSGTIGTTGTTTVLKGANVGLAGTAVKTTGNNLQVTTAGGANLQQTGATNFQLANSNGDVTLASDTDIDLASTFVHSTGALSLTTSNGHILSPVGVMGGTSVNLQATNAISGNTATASLAAAVTGASPTGTINLTNDRAATVSATGPATVNVATSAGSLTVGSAGVVGQTGTALSALGVGDIQVTGSSGRVGNAASSTLIQGNNVGTTANPVNTAGTQVNLQGATVHANNTGASTFNVIHAGGASDVSIQSDAAITLGTTFDTNQATTLSLATSAGSLGFQGAPFTLTGNSVTLSAPAGLGSSSTHLQTAATTLNASATGGSVFIDNTSGTLAAGGTAGTDYRLTSTGPITLSLLTAGGTATVNSQGNLLGSGVNPNVAATSAILTATGGSIGTSAASRLNTQATNLNATGSNGVFIEQIGASTVSATAASGNVDIKANGNMALGLVSASGTVNLQTCPSGSILDGNGAANNIQAGGDTTLISHGTIGTDSDAVEVAVSSGILHVAAGDKINGASINIDGTTPNNSMDVFSPPAGTACFTGLPPGRALFNGRVIFGPPVAPVVVNFGGQPPVAPNQLPMALDSVLVNPFLFNPPAFLDLNGRIGGAAFTPFYTLDLAFLLDKDDWLRFLQETVVWDIDEDEAKGL